MSNSRVDALVETFSNTHRQVKGLVPLLTWFIYYGKGKQFALRDRLKKADAIIVLAGTLGKLGFLHGKIRTTVALYQYGWAPCIIFVGKFSRR